MADPSRTLVNKLVNHHAVTPKWDEKSKPELAKFFSDLGFSRGYGSNPANWNGLINPYTGGRSYAMAQLAGQTVTDRTPDATPAERAAGYRLVPLVNDIWGSICYHAGNWPVNCGSIGIEHLGDYRNYTLSDEAVKVTAAFWRGRDLELNGATTVYGHCEVSQLGTACPCRIMERRDEIVHFINNPPAAPAPVVTPPPAEPRPAPVNPYVKFAEPMNLVAGKQPTNAYDLSKTTWDDLKKAVVKTLNQGDPFVAVGKYTHPLGGVYFMTAFSFGKADETGKPDHTYGVNTVDLGPAPAAPAEPVPPVIPEPDPVPETPVTDTPPADDGSVEVPVKVIPVDPDAWKKSFVSKPGEYTARLDLVVKDMSGQMQDIKLEQKQLVHVTGLFEKDGVTYYRTQRSVEMGWWYGIPVKVGTIDTLLESDDVFDFADELKELTHQLSFKEKLIKWLASFFGWMRRK